MIVSTVPYRKPAREYDPFREFDEMRKRLFEEPFQNGSMGLMNTDVSDTGESYLVESDLPGFRKEDIHLNLNGDTLSIEAERHLAHEDREKKAGYLVTERCSGKYVRSFDVSNVDTARISAKFEDGVLTLTLPKKQPAAPECRRLEIE